MTKKELKEELDALKQRVADLEKRSVIYPPYYLPLGAGNITLPPIFPPTTIICSH